MARVSLEACYKKNLLSNSEFLGRTDFLESVERLNTYCFKVREKLQPYWDPVLGRLTIYT